MRKDGQATWKFIFKNAVIYRRKNYDAMKTYWKNRDWCPFEVYVRSRQGGWDFVMRNVMSEICKCGRRYDQTPNNEVFRYQAHPLEYTIKAMSETMSSPIMCIVCYYREELKEGRWAPKYVKREIGLET